MNRAAMPFLSSPQPGLTAVTATGAIGAAAEEWVPPSDVMDVQTGFPGSLAAQVQPLSKYNRRERADLSTDANWQAQVRRADREGPGIVGASLDLPAAMSMLVDLCIRKRTPQGWVVVKDNPVTQALLSMWRAETMDQKWLFSRLIRTLDGPAEGYLVLENADRPGRIGWRLVQTTQATDNRDGTTAIRSRPDARRGDTSYTEIPNKFVYHAYNADLEWDGLPWSQMRRALPHVDQYRAAMRVISRNLDSQLAMNGILWAQAVGQETKWPDAVMAWSKRGIQSDDGVESVAPFTMATATEPKFIETGAGDPAQKIEVANLFLKAFAQSVDLPTQMLIEGPGQGNHWCVPDDTEAFARGRGWVNRTDLKVGDEILALDHDTGQSTWSTITSLYTADVVDEPMLDLRNERNHSSLSTMCHRWPVIDRSGNRKWRTSATLLASDRILLAAPHADLPTDPKHSDAFVQLVGWYTTEGTCTYKRGRPHQIRIGQSHEANPEDCAEIRRVLTAVFGPAYEVGAPPTEPGWCETIEDRGITIFRLNAAARDVVLAAVPARNKAVPFDVIETFTLAQLHLFLDAVVAGDGSTRGNHRLITQADLERVEAIEYAATLAGVATRLLERTKAQNSHSPGSTSWQLTIKHRTVAIPRHGDNADVPRRTTAYTGTIWCPTTEHGTWFARRDGRSFYTGNSAFLESDHVADVVIAPRIVRACQILTATHLRPMMRGVPDTFGIHEDPEDYEVWYDDSRLRAKTDNTDRIIRAREMGIATREAMAEAVGLSPDQIMELPPGITEYEAWALGRAPASLIPPAVGYAGAPNVISNEREVEPDPAAGQPDMDDTLTSMGQAMSRGPQPPQSAPAAASADDVAAAVIEVEGELKDRIARRGDHWLELVPA